MTEKDYIFDESEECCDSPKISEEEGYYICLNCGARLKRKLTSISQHKTEEVKSKLRELKQRMLYDDHSTEETCDCNEPELCEEEGHTLCLKCGLL